MILKTRHNGDMEARGLSFREPSLSRSGGFAAGVAVTHDATAALPAFSRGVQIKAGELTKLRLRVWRGDGPDRRPVRSTWQARLLARPAYNASQDRFRFWETVAESLGYRNNAFVWKSVTDGRVDGLWALHPDQVMPFVDGSGATRYMVGVGDGYPNPTGLRRGVVDVDGGVVLHVVGCNALGASLAPSPIELFRLTLGAGIARQRYEASLWDRGAGHMLAVSFPQGVTEDQGRAWQDMWESGKYAGPEGMAKTRVIGMGAQIQTISFTPQDAEFIEAGQMGIEDVARIVGLPVSLLDGRAGSVPISPEHESIRLNSYSSEPFRQRVEAAFAADPDLFGSGSRDFPEFESDGVVRGDMATEDLIAHTRVIDGRLTVNEWRASKGLDPVDGGDVAQFTPVGGAVNPAGLLPGGNDNSSDDDEG